MSPSHRAKQAERDAMRALREERDAAAGRLTAKVPDLATLTIAIQEGRAEGCFDNKYLRRVVVEHAAARFEIPCTDADCRDGGHDVTREILSSLMTRKTEFGGKHSCGGTCRTIECTRVLTYLATATYQTSTTAR